MKLHHSFVNTLYKAISVTGQCKHDEGISHNTNRVTERTKSDEDVILKEKVQWNVKRRYSTPYEAQGGCTRTALILSLTSAFDGGSVVNATPAALPPPRIPWVGPTTGLDGYGNSCRHRGSITERSSTGVYRTNFKYYISN